MSSQIEYNVILDAEKTRDRQLSQSDCVRILMDHGYSYGQANNGAYVYLHHGRNMKSKRRGSESEYATILDVFAAVGKEPRECIAHLEHLGFSYGQAHTAVYNYRVKRGLIGR